MTGAQCRRPTCKGQIVNNKCNSCGAFTYSAPGAAAGGGPGLRAPSGPIDLMTREQWRVLTASRFKPRSMRLRQIDRALGKYETDRSSVAFERVKKSFDEWVESKHGQQGAFLSERNRKNAVQMLAAQLSGEKVKLPREYPEFMEEGMENARLGIIYLFGNVNVEQDIFGVILEGGLSIAGSSLDYAKAFNPTQAIGAGYKIAVKGKSLLEVKPGPGGSGTSPPERTIASALESFSKKLLSSLGEALRGIDFEAAVKFVIGRVKSLIKVLAQKFLSAAAPFISGGMDIVQGVAKFVLGAADLIKSWWQGRGVSILSGHPTTIVKALRGAMSRSLFEGLYDALKGATSLGLDIAAASAGAIVNLVWSIVEALCKVVIRLVETFCMSRFCKIARANWQIRDDAHAIHRDPSEFNKWYRRYAIPFPAIAALTLNSRLCGDKMRFLNMFRDNQNVITQAQFDRGCVFVDGLKSYATDYLNDSAFEFKSANPIVSGAIKAAKDKGKLTFRSAVGTVVKEVFVS